MRICSFLPGATEIVAALGLADQLVGVSHECDFPPAVTRVPVMIKPMVGGEPASSADIDRQVKSLVTEGQHLYRLDEQAFLQARPDLILTQDLCHVCAVTPDELTHAVRSLPHPPQMVTLRPTSLMDVMKDIERIANAVHQPAKGQVFADALRRRLDTVRLKTGSWSSRPRVVCLEWLAPLYLAGHWVPEMVELAGGQDVLGSATSPSRQTTWAEIADAQPDIVFVMPCGYAIDRTLRELAGTGDMQTEWMRALDRWPHTYVVDAASYFSRPGPRLVDGVELLAAVLSGGSTTPLDRAKARKLEVAALGKGLGS
jgi:iron complex transport system substrate-binding protein